MKKEDALHVNGEMENCYRDRMNEIMASLSEKMSGFVPAPACFPGLPIFGITCFGAGAPWLAGGCAFSSRSTLRSS